VELSTWTRPLDGGVVDVDLLARRWSCRRGLARLTVA